MKLPWYLRQRPSVALVAGLGGFLSVASFTLAEPWAGTSPHRWWSAVATSADGRTIAAAAIGYYGYSPAFCISTNAGLSWMQSPVPSDNLSSVACSADGMKLVAAARAFWDSTASNYVDGLIYTSSDAGSTWTPTMVPTNNWSSVASSADGGRLVAVAAPFWNGATRSYVGQGVIYRSSDTGATWTQTTAPNTNWIGVASSADGTRLVAVSAPRWDEGLRSWVGAGGIYSSLDSGATWKRTSAPAMYWSCVASAADGVRLVAGVDSGLIYTSADSGASWSRTTAPNTNWIRVASSADGTKLVAGGGSDVYTSSDGGATWTAMGGLEFGFPAGIVACSADGYRLVVAGAWRQICTWPYSGPWRSANAPPDSWGSVACSADGTKLVASGWQRLYRSGDAGATWTQTSAPTGGWSSVASSTDGTRIVAAESSSSSGPIYISPNSGATWTQTSAPITSWISVASSADGTGLVALAAPLWSGSNYIGSGAIYRSSDAGTTWVRASAPSNVWSCVASSADGTKLVAGGEPTAYRSWDAARPGSPPACRAAIGTLWPPRRMAPSSWRRLVLSGIRRRVTTPAAQFITPPMRARPGYGPPPALAHGWL